MATIKDIADKLGISISTVSKGLNGASDISEETRQQVLDTAVELGYITKKKKTDAGANLCVLVRNMDYENINQFGYELIAGFRMAASAKHCPVTVLETSVLKNEPSFEALMKKHHFTGALILGLPATDPYLEEIRNTAFPTVLLDSYVDNPMVGTIATDNVRGVAMAVSHLASLGHKKIGFLNGFRGSEVNHQRLRGFREGMEACGLPCTPSEIFAGDSLSEIHTAVDTFTKQGLTAIVCSSDLIASGVLAELHRRGLNVPSDLSVVGFDDLPIAKYLSPPLTTVRQDRLALGRCAFALIDALTNDLHMGTILMRPTLTIRESTAAPKQS